MTEGPRINREMSTLGGESAGEVICQVAFFRLLHTFSSTTKTLSDMSDMKRVQKTPSVSPGSDLQDSDPI